MSEWESKILALNAEEQRVFNGIVRNMLKATELLEMKTKQMDSITEIILDLQNRILVLEKEVYLTQKEQSK